MKSPPLAFGIEPSKYRYRLRLARYVGLAETVSDVVHEATAHGAASVDLLDLGVGHGRTLRYLEPHGCVDRVRFVGVDISPRRLADIYGGERWKLLQHDIETGLPFEDASFDVIVCEQVLEHLHTPQAAVAEMARVLRPGGTLIVGVPIFLRGIDHLRRRWSERFNRWFGRRSDHPQSFSLHSISRLLRESGGFNLREARGYRIVSGGLFGLLENTQWWWKCNRLLGRLAPWACTEVQMVASKA